MNIWNGRHQSFRHARSTKSHHNEALWQADTYTACQEKPLSLIVRYRENFRYNQLFFCGPRQPIIFAARYGKKVPHPWFNPLLIYLLRSYKMVYFKPFNTHWNHNCFFIWRKAFNGSQLLQFQNKRHFSCGPATSHAAKHTCRCHDSATTGVMTQPQPHGWWRPVDRYGLDILPNYTFYQLDGVLQFNKLTPNFRNSWKETDRLGIRRMNNMRFQSMETIFHFRCCACYGLPHISYTTFECMWGLGLLTNYFKHTYEIFPTID